MTLLQHVGSSHKINTRAGPALGEQTGCCGKRAQVHGDVHSPAIYSRGIDARSRSSNIRRAKFRCLAGPTIRIAIPNKSVVKQLSASLTSPKSNRITAPDSGGTYYYGACVDSVSGESNTGNNCSNGVAVTVSTQHLDVDIDIGTCRAAYNSFFNRTEITIEGTVSSNYSLSFLELTGYIVERGDETEIDTDIIISLDADSEEDFDMYGFYDGRIGRGALCRVRPTEYVVSSATIGIVQSGTTARISRMVGFRVHRHRGWQFRPSSVRRSLVICSGCLGHVGHCVLPGRECHSRESGVQRKRCHGCPRRLGRYWKVVVVPALPCPVAGQHAATDESESRNDQYTATGTLPDLASTSVSLRSRSRTPGSRTSSLHVNKQRLSHFCNID